jgi:hypothetical protein
MRSGQILQFPLSRGLDEDVSAKAHPVSALHTGNNIRWPRAGVIGKRWGTRKLGGLTTVARFLARGSELATVNTSGAVKVYDPVNDTASSISPDVQKTELQWPFTLLDDETGAASSDAAVYGNFVAHAWVSGDPIQTMEATPVPTGAGVLYVQVINRVTGQVLVMPQRISTSGTVHQVCVRLSGSVAFVLYSVGATILYFSINLTTLVVGSPATLNSDRVVSSDHTFNGRFDAIAKADGNLVMVYERNTTTSSALAAVLLTVSGGTLTVTTTVNQTDGTWVDAKAIGIAEDTGGAQVVLIYFRSNTVRIRSFDRVTMAGVAAATTVQSPVLASQVAVRAISANTVMTAWSGYETSSVRLPKLVTETWTVSAGTVAATASTKRQSMGYGLVSRLFTLGGATHAFAVDGRDGEDGGTINSQTTFPSTYLLKLGDFGSSLSGNPPHFVAGKIDHDVGGAFRAGCLPQGMVVSSTTVLGLLPFQADAAQVSFNFRDGIRLVQATQDTTLMTDPWKSVRIGQETYIKGGFLAAWDGRAVFDFGMRAPIVLLVQETANSGYIANGTYVYQFEAGYRSRAGVLHRGPLSAQTTTIISTGPTAGVSIRLCSHGPDGKQTDATGFGNSAGSGVFMSMLRTTANGSVLYQASMPPRYNVFLNDPTLDSVDVTDSSSDTDIGHYTGESPAPAAIALNSRPQPYTAAGELEDCLPPAQLLMHLHGGRIFLVIGDKRTIWFSKDFRENPGIAPGFNPVQIELYDQDITGLASLDEKRIIFWQRGMWYVVGDGPAVSGSDNRFSAPIIIQSDVGCSNPRSIVTTPMGVIFQSNSDLYLLQRNLEVTWLGKSARATLASYPVITSAVLVETDTEVRFTCNSADGTAGIVLVFDYQRGTWFTRTYPTGGPIADAVLLGGVYYLATNGEVRSEDRTINYDVISAVNTYVSSTVELEPIGPSGVIGWQRVRIAKMLGQALGNHAITMSFARDFAMTYEQTKTFDAGSAVTTPGSHMRAEVTLTVQRRQAVGIKLTDAAPSNTTLYPIGNGAGFQLEGIALLVQPVPGLPRDTSTRRGG